MQVLNGGQICCADAGWTPRRVLSLAQTTCELQRSSAVISAAAGLKMCAAGCPARAGVCRGEPPLKIPPDKVVSAAVGVGVSPASQQRSASALLPRLRTAQTEMIGSKARVRKEGRSRSVRPSERGHARWIWSKSRSWAFSRAQQQQHAIACRPGQPSIESRTLQRSRQTQWKSPIPPCHWQQRAEMEQRSISLSSRSDGGSTACIVPPTSPPRQPATTARSRRENSAEEEGARKTDERGGGQR